MLHSSRTKGERLWSVTSPAAELTLRWWLPVLHFHCSMATRRARLVPPAIIASRGIPSFKEAGLGNIDFYIWNGLVAPKGTSPAIINKLSQATQKVLAMPALQKKLGVVFLDAVIGSPADFTQLIQNETASWKKVVTDANLTLLK